MGVRIEEVLGDKSDDGLYLVFKYSRADLASLPRLSLLPSQFSMRTCQVFVLCKRFIMFISGN